MKLKFILLIFAVFLSLSFVSAIIVNEGDSITIQDKENNDRTLTLTAVYSSSEATVSIDNATLEVEDGKFYDFSNVELFVNDIFYTTKDTGLSGLGINDYFVASEGEAYIYIGRNNKEYSFSLMVLSASQIRLIVDGEQYDFTQGEYGEIKGARFYIEDILYVSKETGISAVSIGFSEGGIRLKTCLESWSCFVWGLCIDGKQKRSCTDDNQCGTTFSLPEQSRKCRETTTSGRPSLTGRTCQQWGVECEKGNKESCKLFDAYCRPYASQDQGDCALLGTQCKEGDTKSCEVYSAFCERDESEWDSCDSLATQCKEGSVKSCEIFSAFCENKGHVNCETLAVECKEGDIKSCEMFRGFCKEWDDHDLNTKELTVCGSGCVRDDRCFPFGYRKDSNYCSENSEFVPQLNSDEACENNFECESNVCVSSQCISGSLLQKVINWFKRSFG